MRQLVPERVVALDEHVDDVVRLDVVGERVAGLQVEQLGEDVLGRDGHVVLAQGVGEGRLEAPGLGVDEGTPRKPPALRRNSTLRATSPQ